MVFHVVHAGKHPSTPISPCFLQALPSLDVSRLTRQWITRFAVLIGVGGPFAADGRVVFGFVPGAVLLAGETNTMGLTVRDEAIADTGPHTTDARGGLWVCSSGHGKWFALRTSLDTAEKMFGVAIVVFA